MIDGELGAAIFLRIHRKEPTLRPELFGESATELVLLIVLACGPRSRPAQMLMTFELLAQPCRDLISEFDDMRGIRGYIEIHDSLLLLMSSESRFSSLGVNPRHETRDARLNS